MLLEGLVTYVFCNSWWKWSHHGPHKDESDTAIYNGPVLDGFLQNMIRQCLVASQDTWGTPLIERDSYFGDIATNLGGGFQIWFIFTLI